MQLLLSLALLVGAWATTAEAVPGNTNNNGNHYGWINGNGNGPPPRGSVPIPGTLLLYGVGVAGLAVWQAVRGRQGKP